MTDTYYGFECNCPASVVLDVRIPWENKPPTMACPVCGNTMTFRLQWSADTSGQGSRGDGSAAGQIVQAKTWEPLPAEPEPEWTIKAKDLADSLQVRMSCMEALQAGVKEPAHTFYTGSLHELRRLIDLLRHVKD